jgi:hypothetical protein
MNAHMRAQARQNISMHACTKAHRPVRQTQNNIVCKQNNQQTFEAWMDANKQSMHANGKSTKQAQ